MSDMSNPYKSPETTAVPETTLAVQGALTETMLVYLKEASPWMRFIGILGFISSGLTALSGISSIAIIPLVRELSNELSGTLGPFSFLFGTALSGGLIVLCLGGAALIFAPSLFLYRSGEKIRGYIRTGNDAELELAFKNNKSFWKFAGIICIISLAFIPLMIIIGIAAAVISALT